MFGFGHLVLMEGGDWLRPLVFVVVVRRVLGFGHLVLEEGRMGFGHLLMKRRGLASATCLLLVRMGGVGLRPLGVD